MDKQTKTNGQMEGLPVGQDTQTVQVYLIPAPLLQVTVDILSTMPFKDVGNIIPLLSQLQKAETGG